MSRADHDYLVFTDHTDHASKRALRPEDVGSMNAVELHAARKFLVVLMSVINGRLAILEGVAASDGPGRPSERPRDPLRDAEEDHTLPARVEQAKRALAGDTDEQEEARERAAEVKRALRGAR